MILSKLKEYFAGLLGIKNNFSKSVFKAIEWA
jgi:hypothetical protein